MPYPFVPLRFERISAHESRARVQAFLAAMRRRRTVREYIDLPIPELYDLAADPAEKQNLAASRPVEVDRLRGVLTGLLAHDRKAARAPESGETVERLRALGHLAGGEAPPKERYTEADDPKRLIQLGDPSSRMPSPAGALSGRRPHRRP